MITTPHHAHVGAPAAPMPRPRPAALARLAAWHWPRLALGAVLALAALLNVWALDRLGYANTDYAAAVKSTLQSWHNFVFVSFDGEMARTLGYRTWLWDLLLFETFALASSVATRSIGALPVFGFMVLPPAAALLLGKRLCTAV